MAWQTDIDLNIMTTCTQDKELQQLPNITNNSEEEKKNEVMRVKLFMKTVQLFQLFQAYPEEKSSVIKEERKEQHIPDKPITNKIYYVIIEQ